MKQIIVSILLVCMFATRAAWAAEHLFYNEQGGASLSVDGVLSTGSQLVYCFGIVAPDGHSLGSITFATGPLTSGTLEAGGTFSPEGSSFVVKGRGNYGEPKGTIFVGGFRGKIHWTLVSKSGAKLVFELRGPVQGQLYDGRIVNVSTTQAIVTSEAQLSRGIGHILTGKTIAYP